MSESLIEEVKKFDLTPTESNFILSKARYPAYVGGWATGKSLAGIGRAVKLSDDYKQNLGVIFRKEFTDLRDSTVKDFERYTGLKVDSSREVKFRENGSQILFRHLEEVNNLQNLNLGWFWIEQAEELETDDQFFMLWGRLRREGMPHSGFITANTNGHNWIYKLWKLGTLENGKLYEARTLDSENVKHLSDDFIKSLDDLKVRKPKFYRRFVENSWDEADTVDVIIVPDLVEAALKRTVNVRVPLRRVVSVDVARFGDDKTVFYAIEGDDRFRRVLAKETHEKRNTMETVGLVTLFAKKYGGIESFAVDEIGIGAGVVDRLRELEKHVIPVNSAERDGIRLGCYNRRAEIYVVAAEAFEAGRIQLLAGDEEAREELSWARYKTIKSSGVYQVESKDDIKERYTRSPDHSDALLYGLWAISKAKIVAGPDKYARHNMKSDSVSALSVFG